MSAKFYPPQPNSALILLIQGLSQWIGRWQSRVKLSISPADLQVLKQLGQSRVILFPNHPTFHEPVLLFMLSARLRQRFYYLAAYELFRGPMRWFFQGIGVYSIRRGLVDRESIQYTVNLLQQPHSHWVVFSEGRCTFQSDRLMPFQTGGIQLAFQALNKQAKSLPPGTPLPPLYAVPITIHYRYLRPIETVVDSTLADLEAALEVPTLADPQPGDRYKRLRLLADTVLRRMEADYDIPPLATDLPPEEQNWNERIALLKRTLLETCEQHLGLPHNHNQPLRDRAYRIQAALGEQEPHEKTPLLRASVERLLNFDTIYDGYVAENPTPERYLDTLARLQREVFQIDQPPPKGLRRAEVKVGEPMNLVDWFEAYQGDRSGTVQQLTDKLQATVQLNLDRLIQASQTDAPEVSP